MDSGKRTYCVDTQGFENQEVSLLLGELPKQIPDHVSSSEDGGRQPTRYRKHSHMLQRRPGERMAMRSGSDTSMPAMRPVRRTLSQLCSQAGAEARLMGRGTDLFAFTNEGSSVAEPRSHLMTDRS